MRVLLQAAVAADAAANAVVDVHAITATAAVTDTANAADDPRANTAAANATATGAETFNAAKFLFLSFRVAQQCGDLQAAKVITQFSTVWPKQSYQQVKDVSTQYSKKFSIVTKVGIDCLVDLFSRCCMSLRSLRNCC